MPHEKPYTPPKTFGLRPGTHNMYPAETLYDIHERMMNDPVPLERISAIHHQGGIEAAQHAPQTGTPGAQGGYGK